MVILIIIEIVRGIGRGIGIGIVIGIVIGTVKMVKSENSKISKISERNRNN